MINSAEYHQWLEENEEMLNILMVNDTMIYKRLEDVFNVVNYIDAIYLSQKFVDEDMQVIFDVGFGFLYESIEEVKLYYDTYFSQDLVAFMKYDSLINYSLYLDDLRHSLIENDLYTEEVRLIFSDILEEVDDIISSQLQYQINDLEDFNRELDYVIGNLEVITTLEIFGRIAEELMV